MSNYLPSSEVIGRNAEAIAAVLKRRLSPKRLSGRAREDIRNAMFVVRRTSDLAALGKALDLAANAIAEPRDRAYAICRLLLESAWAVPPGSDLEKYLRRRISRAFRDCREIDKDRYAALREELIVHQWSSLPVVRRLVSGALADEPVAEAEVPMLADDRRPHDARCAIAARVIVGNSSPHLGEVFEYFVRAIRQVDRERTALQSVDVLTALLRQYRSKELLGYLLPMLTRHKDDWIIAGKLMVLLREYGDPLAMNLAQLYREGNPNERSAFARLLRHMAQHGHNVLAAEVMADLLLESHGEAVELSDSFVKAVRGTFTQDLNTETATLRRVFQESLNRLEETGEPRLQSMSSKLREEIESQADAREMVRKYLDGKLDLATAYLLRYCGHDGLEALESASLDRGRDLQQRRKAIEMLSLLRNPRVKGLVPEIAWGIYTSEEDTIVRAAALNVVAESHRLLTEADLLRLMEDERIATGALRLVFVEYHNVLFPSVSPEMRSEEASS